MGAAKENKQSAKVMAVDSLLSFCSVSADDGTTGSRAGAIKWQENKEQVAPVYRNADNRLVDRFSLNNNNNNNNNIIYCPQKANTI